VPFLSKRDNEIHKRHGPTQPTCHIRQKVTLSFFSWFSVIAGSLKSLTVVRGGPDHLSQMLTLAAFRAPDLSKLHIGGDPKFPFTADWIDTPVLKSLALLTQIQTLNLEGWQFPPAGDTSGMQCLARIKSIQVGL